MLKRILATLTAATSILLLTTAVSTQPSGASGYKTVCSTWETAGFIQFRACAIDHIDGVWHTITVRNLSVSTALTSDLRVEVVRNEALVKTCTWDNVPIGTIQTIERICKTTRVDNAKHRAIAYWRPGTGQVLFSSQATPNLYL